MARSLRTFPLRGKSDRLLAVLNGGELAVQLGSVDAKQPGGGRDVVARGGHCATDQDGLGFFEVERKLLPKRLRRFGGAFARGARWRGGGGQAPATGCCGLKEV